MQLDVLSSFMELIECSSKLLPNDPLLVMLTIFDVYVDFVNCSKSWLNSDTIVFMVGA